LKSKQARETRQVEKPKWTVHPQAKSKTSQEEQTNEQVMGETVNFSELQTAFFREEVRERIIIIARP